MLPQFSQLCTQLIQQEPHWAWWLQRFERRLSSAMPEGLIARWISGKPVLQMHPAWIKQVKMDIGCAEIKHAVMHFILGHPALYQAEDEPTNLDAWMDGQVAYFLGTLPRDWETRIPWDQPLTSLIQMPIETVDLAPLRASDHHMVWAETAAPSSNELAPLQWRYLIQQASQQTEKTMPPRIQSFLQRQTQAPAIPWERVLRQFARKYGNRSLGHTNHRKSKRFGTFPGLRIRKSGKLLVAIDTSGSVGEEQLQGFFTEIWQLHQQGLDLLILESDYTLQRKYTFQGRFPKQVKGRGGTDFNPAIQYAQEQETGDALIYFTDGQAPPPRVPIRLPLLWVFCGSAAVSMEHWKQFPGQYAIMPKA